MIDLSDLFSASGPLASVLPTFRPRPQQLAMAERIQAAIIDRKVLVVEAGTGTGKTLAYLVPALLSGGKVILSTGSKTLQDQLFLRDLPAVRKALNAPVKIALLKGRANYVCHYHLARTERDGRLLNREDATHLPKIVRFALTSQSGDKGELASVPETASVWHSVTSTRDNCLGQECPQYEECFVVKARREAMQADVVVVNHHLFFADVALKHEGVAELLPACNTVVFDEAHQLPDIASQFFGETVSSSQILELARDTRAYAFVHAKDFAALPDASHALEIASRELRLHFRADAARFSEADVRQQDGFSEKFADLQAAMDTLTTLLETQAGRAEELLRCFERATALHESVMAWSGSGGLSEEIRWCEVTTHGWQLHRTPVNIGPLFNRQVENSQKSWIFTSATLSVAGDFSHYNHEMGLYEAECHSWDSPFDYPNQALLYVPSGMPDPNTPGYTAAVVDAAWPLIQAAGGRAFVLFTSLRAMRDAHERLSQKMATEKVTFPLLLQGQGTRTELLTQFRRAGNAVLVASQSFWEGIDVPGDALMLVVIDRLPFAAPDDPVLAARLQHMEKKGLNPFAHYQVPRAVINLKQGAGRLIRSETDRGVLMICDPRLVEKPYGKRIWRSLPAMHRTREASEAAGFFAEKT